MKLSALVILTLLARSQARQGFGTEEQDWGYVTVRPGAHMFWWLYFTTATENYGERPLIVWLQGGPGASSTGYGNFAELGPLDLDLNPRDHTWTKDVNVLFVDNPVGTGFISYAESTAQLTTTNRQIAEDFVELMRGFYTEHPEFVNSPFYILSQSYGGKMAIEMGQVLDEAIKAGTIESNFIGVGLGDPWVDPVTLVLEWAPYLLAVGAVDQAGHDAVAAASLRTKELFDQGLYAQSTTQWRITENVISREAHNIDFYDILKPIPAHNGE
ncbi:Serine carboxypeptidase [Popillia japonica]|uniref:Serine carboxypeptidase n=1 Tax=Popillia japonica TaxID=7064 RepID=A0AAW1JY50_POPJA